MQGSRRSSRRAVAAAVFRARGPHLCPGRAATEKSTYCTRCDGSASGRLTTARYCWRARAVLPSASSSRARSRLSSGTLLPRIGDEVFQDLAGFQQVLFSAAARQQGGLQPLFAADAWTPGVSINSATPAIFSPPRGQQRPTFAARERVRVQLQHVRSTSSAAAGSWLNRKPRVVPAPPCGPGSAVGLLRTGRSVFLRNSASFFPALQISSYPWARTKARSAAGILTFLSSSSRVFAARSSWRVRR